MKCAKLHLQERTRVRPKSEPRHDKPRRYCQKLLVDPQFEENPKWTNALRRFHCEEYESCDVNRKATNRNKLDQDDIFLSVQTLQFKGKLHDSKRPRTSFKYKTLTDCQKHRMFVKQVVEEISSYCGGDRASELTCYYYDDYVKYFHGNDRSRSSSVNSSILLQNFGNKLRRNKSVQVDFNILLQTRKDTKSLTVEDINDGNIEKNNPEVKEDGKENNNISEDDAKIAFHRHGKRKSITISKVESPETVQVIRVDVVCNYSCSSATSNCDDNNKRSSRNQIGSMVTKKDDTNLRGTHFGDKYLLTKSVKALDENISGGANVTLLCKTFRLADRTKTSTDKKLKKHNISQRCKDINN